MSSESIHVCEVEYFLASLKREQARHPRPTLPEPVGPVRASLPDTAQPRARVLLDRNVRALSTFVRTKFDPNSDESWREADRLYRAALMVRDVVRS